MFDSDLKQLFLRLRQGDKQSVQDGQSFNDLEMYLHTSRSVEQHLYEDMLEINMIGGGVIFLIGSAGDGKSHLMSSVKSKYPELCRDFIFHNDATESYSPTMTSIETLKYALREFSDMSITTTSCKMVVAINLGKLSAFIDDNEAKEIYSRLIKSVHGLVGRGDNIMSSRIKYIDFSCLQFFELKLNDNGEYPVTSRFLKTLLEKITKPASDNPFYMAYINMPDKYDPIATNYQLLSYKSIQNSIVKLTIEAIIRFKLIVTPREFLDFISSIIVYKKLSDYKENANFFDALLPSLLFDGGDNQIVKMISKLDPIKYSSTDHDSQLAQLFTSSSVPEDYVGENFATLKITNIINKFYQSNGRHINNITKFLFRYKHLCNYHSESDVYVSFLNTLRGYYRNENSFLQLYDLVDEAIPRHYGSYYTKQDLVPLNIQGSQYKLFAAVTKEIDFKPAEYKPERPNEFNIFIGLDWLVQNEQIHLDIDYQLYEYLVTLSKGRLSLNFEGDKSHGFSRFIRSLIKYSSSKKRITILTENNEERVLTQVMGNIIKLN